jgi:asparagine synthase (glutamine-hydrolysing)
VRTAEDSGALLACEEVSSAASESRWSEMSGIVAILGRSEQPATETVERMLAAAPHRGSDTQVGTCGEASLGIANPADRREACLTVEDGWGAAFAGRLDNDGELATALRRTGVDVVDPSPSGLVLAAFRAMGDRAPGALRGAFSAAVTDGRRMWFFRDQIGFETLFHREDGDRVYVASEAKQILAGSGVRREPDLEFLEHVFYDDIDDHTRTAYSGVRRVLASVLVEVDREGGRWRRYWHPASLLESGRYSSEEVAERFSDLMTRSVDRMMTGPDAVSLSGGIDSPGLAAFAGPLHERRFGRPLAAISAIYPGFPRADERAYIQEIADFLDLPLHVYEPVPQRLTQLRQWVELFDGPWTTWSPVGAQQRLGLARELGFGTILDGNMAEQVMAMQRALVAHLLWQGRVRAAFGYLRRDRAEGASWRRIGRQLLTPLVPKWIVSEYRKRNPPLALPPWISQNRPDRLAMESVPLRHLWADSQVGWLGGSSLALEASTIFHARYGVRERFPWADIDLWEFFLSIPAETKFPGPLPKTLVRQLLRGKLPDRILDRRDKTTMNDWYEATSLDYPSLRRWLLDPRHMVSGVDYRQLADQLEREDMTMSDYVWAKDLAGIHAFLELW